MMPGGMGGGMPMGPLPPLTEADIAELENLYQSLTANMTQEEKDALQKMGEDLVNQYMGPQAPMPPKQEAPKPQQKPTLPPLRPESGEKTEIAAPVTPMSLQQQQHIQNELETFIKNFSNLQTMIETSPDFATALRQWRQDINDILYSVKVINKSEHHTRLSSPEFARLLKTIEQINSAFKHKAFSDACSQTEGCKNDLLDDPYAILHVSPSASQKEIEKAYQAIQKKFEAAKKKTERKGLTTVERKKELRSAQYSLDLATNAYDLIKDPKMRAILDEERQAKRSAEYSMHMSIRQLLSIINQELGMAIYNNQFMNDLDNFLKKYEPAQLEARKKMEQAEAERLKELKEQEARKPIGKVVHVAKDRGQAWDIPWYPQGGYPTYPYGGGAGGGSYHPGLPQTGPGVQPSSKPTADAPKPQTGGGLLKDGEKEPKTEAEKKAAEEKAKQQQGIPSQKSDQDKQQLIPDKTVMDIWDLDKDMKTFNDLFDREYFETITASKTEPGKKGTVPQTVVLTPQTKKEVQEKLEEIYEDSEPTPDEISQKIDTIKETIDDADDTHKKSYQTAWNDLQNRKTFEDNTKLLNTILETVTKDEQQRKPKGLTRGGSDAEAEQEKSTPAKLFETIKAMRKNIKDLNGQFKTEETEKKRAEKAKAEAEKPFWQKTKKEN